jgi:hypothetical protein
MISCNYKEGIYKVFLPISDGSLNTILFIYDRAHISFVKPDT